MVLAIEPLSLSIGIVLGVLGTVFYTWHQERKRRKEARINKTFQTNFPGCSLDGPLP